MAGTFMPYTSASPYPFAFEDAFKSLAWTHEEDALIPSRSRLTSDAEYWTSIGDWNDSHFTLPTDGFLETPDPWDFPTAYQVHELGLNPLSPKDLRASLQRDSDNLEEGLMPGQSFHSPQSPFSAMSSSCSSGFSSDDEWSFHVGPDQYPFFTAGGPVISFACQQTYFSDASIFPLTEDVKHINMNDLQCFEDSQVFMAHDNNDFIWKNDYTHDNRTQDHRATQHDRRLDIVPADMERSPQILPLIRPTRKVPAAVIKPKKDTEISDDQVIEDSEDRQVSDNEDAGEHGDAEYRPRNAYNKRKQRPQRSTAVPAPKKSKTDGKAPRSKVHNRCKSCAYIGSTKLLLLKHTTTVHVRPFVCAFAFAGCEAKFGSKNEWKRHVSSQHLALSHWCCTIGPCGRSVTRKKASVWQRGSIFNRKDLFTQHLLRMHAPDEIKNQKSRNRDWEVQVRIYQEASRRDVRQPPTKTRCPVKGCGESFTGAGCWDNRMEHVGKHVESNANGAELEMEIDEDLIKWAVETNVVERQKSGWSLSAGTEAMGTQNMDEDADFEDE